jgi:hypothetical protein
LCYGYQYTSVGQHRYPHNRAYIRSEYSYPHICAKHCYSYVRTWYSYQHAPCGIGYFYNRTFAHDMPDPVQ